MRSYAPDACGGGTPSSTTAEVVSRAAPPLRSVDCATRTRIANRVEQKKPHLLMQSTGQSASTLCSDNREEIPIASARRQRAAKRGASRQAAAQTRSAEATCSDATGPMSLSGASQPHIQTAAVHPQRVSINAPPTALQPAHAHHRPKAWQPQRKAGAKPSSA